MGSVFAMQGFGQLAGALVMLFVTMGFKESLINVKTYAQCTGVCGLAVDKMWRTLVGKSLVCRVNCNLANHILQVSAPFQHAVLYTTASPSQVRTPLLETPVLGFRTNRYSRDTPIHFRCRSGHREG